MFYRLPNRLQIEKTFNKERSKNQVIAETHV